MSSSKSKPGPESSSPRAFVDVGAEKQAGSGAGKPLFIPLKTEYYRQFENGTKTHEYRRYGGPWNERTCFVGRPVTISRGYSTPDRLSAVVKGFRQVSAYMISDPVGRDAAVKLYGEFEIIADIELELL